MNAVGIFLGRQAEGCSVSILSASRRRDHIVVVFEERRPSDTIAAKHQNSDPSLRQPPGTLPFHEFRGGAAPGPAVHGVSPWAIALIDRTDLPITVVQRMFR
jgi:hypothetical protein